MFGFIKKFFSGIAAFFSGLLGGKKSQDDQSNAPQIAPKRKKGSGYYMELDDSDNSKPVAETKKPEPRKVEPAPEAKQPEPVKAAVATLERPKAEPEAKSKKPEPAKTSAASENGKINIEAQPNPPAPANNGKVNPQAELTFAPNYLLPTATNSRRRPGPSMDMFRDMARQVKTPS